MIDSRRLRRQRWYSAEAAINKSAAEGILGILRLIAVLRALPFFSLSAPSDLTTKTME